MFKAHHGTAESGGTNLPATTNGRGLKSLILCRPPPSILGNLTISGSIDGNSAVVSGGSIGSTVFGTALNCGAVNGIVAAVGSISVGKIGTTSNALYYKQNDTQDAAVIDAVFGQGVTPLSAADLFDQSTLGDLLNLDQILVNLDVLTVKNGHLSLP